MRLIDTGRGVTYAPFTLAEAGLVPPPITATGKVLSDNGTWIVAGGGAAGVTSFNTRTGAVTLTSGDITTALGYTPTSVVGLTGSQTVASFKTGLTLVKADVGLGSVDNTADNTKNVLSATKLTTARNINGIAFDGTANITINAVDSTARLASSAVSVFMLTVLDDPDAATARATLGAQASGSYAVTTRLINTTAPLAGGGDLSADRTLSINAATTALPGSMSAQDKTRLDAAASFYRTLLDCSGSHTAARAIGTYWMPQGQILGITGVGTAYPPNVIYFDPTDFPAIGTLTGKLRIRVGLYTNDVAPGGNYTFGLYPVTRPATSGGVGVGIFTMGAVVAGSTVLFTAPAADGLLNGASADFAMPVAGHYVIGVITTASVAASAHILVSAILQLRYS